MKNELDFDKETDTKAELIKSKRCGQSFPISAFKIIN